MEHGRGRKNIRLVNMSFKDAEKLYNYVKQKVKKALPRINEFLLGKLTSGKVS